jgi:L-alanine-DL-glutamate epimerase-like enolase superfamily enzyme
MVDVHGSLDEAAPIRLARASEKCDIVWIEQLVSPGDHAGQAEVRRAPDIARRDIVRAGGMTEIPRITSLAGIAMLIAFMPKLLNKG